MYDDICCCPHACKAPRHLLHMHVCTVGAPHKRHAMPCHAHAQCSEILRWELQDAGSLQLAALGFFFSFKKNVVGRCSLAGIETFVILAHHPSVLIERRRTKNGSLIQPSLVVHLNESFFGSGQIFRS